MSLVTLAEMADFLRREFPQTRVTVESLSADEIVVAHEVGPAELRPGGTVSGPVMMTVADVALYVALLHRIGLVPLAVTTSLSINFLRKPSADRRVLGRCKLMKLGKSLAVGEVWIHSEGVDDPVAHATGTYAIPRERAASSS